MKKGRKKGGKNKQRTPFSGRFMKGKTYSREQIGKELGKIDFYDFPFRFILSNGTNILSTPRELKIAWDHALEKTIIEVLNKKEARDANVTKK